MKKGRMEFSLFLSSYIRKQQVFDMRGEILQVEYFSSLGEACITKSK